MAGGKRAVANTDVAEQKPGPSLVVQLGALALVTAGAAGNLWDRLRSTRGVVDFIDIGLVGSRFWIFNIADVLLLVGIAIIFLRTLFAPSSGKDVKTQETPRPAA